MPLELQLKQNQTLIASVLHKYAASFTFTGESFGQNSVKKMSDEKRIGRV